MKFNLIADEELLPKSLAARSAFFKGALAHHDGKGLHTNPYRGNTGWGSYFYQSWSQGWRMASAGRCKIEEVAADKE